MYEVTNEDLKVIEDFLREPIPSKLQCRMATELWQRMKNIKLGNNCFCSSSSRTTFKKNFFNMYEQFKLENK